jgi:NAD(P)-dependent dehydrogenase (short-subunit alcohol dehydrogenase family)
MLDVNLPGPLLMTHAVLPAMRRRRSGTIVNVASLLGKTGAADYVAYCPIKFGVVGFTEALADELTRTGCACGRSVRAPSIRRWRGRPA